jgi:hypothetical protein
MTAYAFGIGWLGIRLAVALAGAAGAPTAPLASVDNPRSSGPDYVLLTMDQAAMFRGAQSHTTCTGTREYMGCTHGNRYCQDEPQGTCAGALEHRYSNARPTYCVIEPPGPQGTCSSLEAVLCYTWWECQWNVFSGCVPVGAGHASTIDPSVCNVPAPDPPPNQGGG